MSLIGLTADKSVVDVELVYYILSYKAARKMFNFTKTSVAI